MIVVDTNVIAYLFLNSTQSTLAEQALMKDPNWAAPLLWRSELRNVLALYMRNELLTRDEAGNIMQLAERLLQGREYQVASARVLELAKSFTGSAYDCEFVSLAHDLDVPLVTVDRQILAAFPEAAVDLKSFVTDL